jgi:hypothetical protein
VAEAGSATELARRARTNDPYLNQMRRKFSTRKATPRGTGDDPAARVEKGMGKPRGREA